jgi:hypothetical protein
MQARDPQALTSWLTLLIFSTLQLTVQVTSRHFLSVLIVLNAALPSCYTGLYLFSIYQYIIKYLTTTYSSFCRMASR